MSMDALAAPVEESIIYQKIGEMELPEEEVVAQAKEITELREQLRWAAAAAANQPDQLQYYEEAELEQLRARVSQDHYPLQGQQKRERQRAQRAR